MLRVGKFMRTIIILVTKRGLDHGVLTFRDVELI